VGARSERESRHMDGVAHFAKGALCGRESDAQSADGAAGAWDRQIEVEPPGLSTYDIRIVPRLFLLTQSHNYRRLDEWRTLLPLGHLP
jgi:hypothetical protein